MPHEQSKPVRIRIHLMRRHASGVTTTRQPWYWHASLGNGEIVAQGEQYENRADAVTMLTHLFGLDAFAVEQLREDGLVTLVREVA